MNHLSRIKWISAFLSALFIGIFEFVRHQFLHVISMDWGNLLVAALAGLLFLIYFHGIFSILENLYGKLQKEKEETAVLQERYRIARELHDSVAQALFFMNIKIKAIEKAVKEDEKPVAAIAELKEAVLLTDADIRKHIFVLQRFSPNNINLTAAVRQYLEEYAKESAGKVRLNLAGDFDTRLSYQVKNQLLYIFQELIRNIKKHAQANCVTVELKLAGRQFSLTVADDGQGFGLEKWVNNETSFGLKMVRHDAAVIGGRLDIQSQMGRGTWIRLNLDVE